MAGRILNSGQRGLGCVSESLLAESRRGVVGAAWELRVRATILALEHDCGYA